MAAMGADQQIGPGLSFSKRAQGARLVSGHTKACHKQTLRSIWGFECFDRSGWEAPAQAELRPTGPGK
jgi:hypothetical protein